MALFKRRGYGKAGDWYYCIKHATVEEGPECPAKDRLGPYPSREEAARAIEIAAERNEEWRDDPRWQDPDADTARPPGEGDGDGRG